MMVEEDNHSRGGDPGQQEAAGQIRLASEAWLEWEKAETHHVERKPRSGASQPSVPKQSLGTRKRVATDTYYTRLFIRLT